MCVVIATDSKLLKIMTFQSKNINLSVQLNVSRMKLRHTKSENIKLPRIRHFLKTLSNHLKRRAARGMITTHRNVNKKMMEERDRRIVLK